MRTAEPESIALLPKLPNIPNVARRGIGKPRARDQHCENDEAKDRAALRRTSRTLASVKLPPLPTSFHARVAGKGSLADDCGSTANVTMRSSV